jgi:hypothetical protein
LSTEERIFTLAEAIGALPRLRSILKEVAEEWQRIKEMNPMIQKARDAAQYDGFSPYGARYVETVSHMMVQFQHIREMGILLKDVDRGLCDFPYRRQGRVVYLCWHMGENTIEYWHDIEAGFAGRQPLDDSDK